MALNNNAQYAYRYLQERYKLTPAQAAGIVGNLMQESGLNTGARNPGDGSDGSDSIGIAQWNGARARNLHAFAKARERNVSALDTQLDFLMHEMSGEGGFGGGSERTAYNNLMKAQNYTDAAKAFIGFERPQGWKADNPTGGHGWNNRHKYAGLLVGLSPDQIVSQSDQAQQVAVANNPAQTEVAQTTPEQPPSRNGVLIEAYNKITGNNVQVPDKILGVETDKLTKGFGALGDFAQTLSEADQTINSQIQQAAQAARSRVNDAPVELQFFSSLPQKKKKGALAGLGGYLI